MGALDQLKRYIEKHGPIKTARVSSAQARGAAKKWSYWGVARYEMYINAKGDVVNRALERAGSDRRSTKLADDDLKTLCEREGRIYVYRIGTITEYDALRIMKKLVDDSLRKYVERRCDAG